MGRFQHGRKLCTLGLSIWLAACGGGGDDSPPAQVQDASNADPAAAADVPGSPAIESLPPASVNNPPASDSNSAPTISGQPLSAALVGTQYAFGPTAKDPDGDVLTFRIKQKPGWATFSAATGQLRGTPRSTDVGTYQNVVISVTDGAAETALKAFGVTVGIVANGSATVTWVPPTQNTDGSPLTDLAGYKIYWGTSPGVYSNSLTVDNPGLAAYVVENLVPAKYYFVATAVNAEGVESEPSNVATGEVI